MEKSLKHLLFGVFALLVVLGCNFGSDMVDNSNSSDVSTDPLPVLSLTVTNNSGRTVCSLYVAPQETTEWGEERLGTEVLDTGESYGIELPDGTYRVRANDCDSNLIAEYSDFEVDGATTLRVEEKTVLNTLVAVGEPGTLTVINNSSDDVCYVYVSPADSSSWGSDRLGESTILDRGESETITVGAGLYDLQAADCDGDALAEQYDIDFAAGYTWTLE